jgi:hypothetical protein
MLFANSVEQPNNSIDTPVEAYSVLLNVRRDMSSKLLSIDGRLV